jgi:hypothetical protein
MMLGRWKYRDDYDVVVAWQAKVSDAAVPFEARWTEAGLRRIDPDLYARFQRQRELFNNAVEGGSLDEVATHGGAMVRAYIAVFTAMEGAGAPDDAYQVARGPNGLTIAIGPKPCCARVQELYGDVVHGSRLTRSRPSLRWMRGSRHLPMSSACSPEPR